jgi:PAS domain S-box-containing protein
MSATSSDQLSALSVPQTRVRHHLSLHWRLVLLVVAGVVPLLAFSLGHQYLQYRKEVTTTGRQTLALARSMALLVEQELQVQIAALQTLTVSRPLQAGDFDAFRAQAETVVATQFPGANIVQLKQDGRQLMNTILPAGAPLPVRRNLESTRQVFATSRPTVSNLYQGAVGPRPVVAIDVPVNGPDGAVAYVLSLNPRLEAFAEVIRHQHTPETWVVSVFDRHGVNVAWIPNGDRFVGQAGSTSLLGPLRAEREGIVETTSLEGTPLLTVFSRAEPFGWAVAIGVPRAELTGPALSEALRTLAIGGALLAIGLVLALYAARGIAGPIDALRRLAAARDGDAPFNPSFTGLRETDEVVAALRSAEERRKRSERRFQDIAEVSGDWMWETDPEHRFSLLLGERTKPTPPQREALIGRTLWEIADADPVTDGPWVQHKAQLEAHQPFRHFRYEVATPDGGQMHVSVSGKPVFDEARNFLGYRGTATDETAIVEAGRQAEAAEALLRRVFETSQDLILVTDREGNFIRVSPSAMSVLGYDPVEMVGRSAVEFLYSEDLDNTRNEMRIARRAGVTQSFECRYVHKHGQLVTLWWKGVWSVPEQQHFFFGRDITDRKETERRLRESDEQLRRAQRLAQVGSNLSDLRTGAVEWSDETYRIYGVSRDTFIPSGPSILGMIHPDDRARVSASMEQRRQGIAPAPFEYRLIRPDGAVRHIYGESEIIKDEAGDPRYVAGIIHDITEPKAAEKALRESEQAARGIIDSALDAVIQMDETGIITEWNSRAEAVFGWSRAEALGRQLSTLVVPPGNRARYEAGLARFLATGQSTAIGKRFAIDALHRDGREVKVELAITALQRGSGHVFNGFVRDLTQQLVIEGQLRQAQKMEAIGNLTGGMAPDFNNFLGIIVGNLDLARERIGGDEELGEIVGEALEAAWRGADLTRRLLAFARRQPLRPALIDVNELVGNTIRLLRRLLGEDVEISLNLAEYIWPVMADPAQLEVSLANLATNARDAMPKGGRLIVATGNRQLDANYAAEHADATEGDFAMIEVSDTGIGMSAEIMSQIFEPFFTTKDVGKGTGLGLSMVFGFLRQSGGHVAVYSEPGVGTTFRLYLPRATAKDAAREVSTQDAVARGAGERVLVVEDNPAMRRVVMRQLRELGYCVVECDRAAAALEMLQDEPVDLMFTDIVMPGGLAGIELARLARERWPGLKVVLTSGFPQARVDGNGELLGTSQLLSKPYRKEALAAALRTALDG